MDLFVLNADGGKVPVYVSPATKDDLRATKDWQTRWTSAAARKMPNKVALRCKGSDELLGLMSYSVDNRIMVVNIIYIENAWHSNANLLHQTKQKKKYIDIPKALFAYAAYISKSNGFGGILVLHAKTTELVKHYIDVYGARHAGAYDQNRLIIWEDAAQNLIDYFERGELQHET